MQIHHGFYGQAALAKPFFELQRKAFPFLRLEWAYDHQLLPTSVVPFGLFDGNRAVSILNATQMDLVVGDRMIKAVQLGTVATDPDAREHGLSRTLITHVFEHYRSSRDTFFLFANKRVLGFYPKVGFSPIQVSHFTVPLAKRDEAVSFRKLDVNNRNDEMLISDLIENRVPLSRTFGVADYSMIAKWYCVTAYKQQLWHSDQLDTMLVGAAEASKLVIHDIVSRRHNRDLFKQLSWPGVKEASLGFIPDLFDGPFRKDTTQEDDYMFGIGDIWAQEFTVNIPTLAHT